MEPGTKHRFHEFFAGSGLVGCGLSNSFRSVWANDVSERKARVYRANFDPWVLHVGDIADVKGKSCPPPPSLGLPFPVKIFHLRAISRGFILNVPVLSGNGSACLTSRVTPPLA